MSQTSAVEALLTLARTHTDPEAAQALVDAAVLEAAGRRTVYPDQAVAPRRFVLRRTEDVSGVSGLGDVADGVLWPDGTAAVRWRGEHPSTVHWDRGRASVELVHGHDGRTQVLFLDQDDEHLPPMPGADDVPLRVRRVLEHAVRRPVPCPKCRRTAVCRCIADRTAARVDAIAEAVAPFLGGVA